MSLYIIALSRLQSSSSQWLAILCIIHQHLLISYLQSALYTYVKYNSITVLKSTFHWYVVSYRYLFLCSRCQLTKPSII